MHLISNAPISNDHSITRDLQRLTIPKALADRHYNNNNNNNNPICKAPECQKTSVALSLRYRTVCSNESYLIILLPRDDVLARYMQIMPRCTPTGENPPVSSAPPSVTASVKL